MRDRDVILEQYFKCWKDYCYASIFANVKFRAHQFSTFTWGWMLSRGLLYLIRLIDKG